MCVMIILNRCESNRQFSIVVMLFWYSIPHRYNSCIVNSFKTKEVFMTSLIRIKVFRLSVFMCSCVRYRIHVVTCHWTVAMKSIQAQTVARKVKCFSKFIVSQHFATKTNKNGFLVDNRIRFVFKNTQSHSKCIHVSFIAVCMSSILSLCFDLNLY